jgi:hypothetical protein
MLLLLIGLKPPEYNLTQVVKDNHLPPHPLLVLHTCQLLLQSSCFLLSRTQLCQHIFVQLHATARFAVLPTAAAAALCQELASIASSMTTKSFYSSVDLYQQARLAVERGHRVVDPHAICTTGTTRQSQLNLRNAN